MKKIGAVALAVLGVGALIWVNYALFSGRIIDLPPEVQAALKSDEAVEVALLEGGSWLVMTPREAVPSTGLILFPEGRMDIRTYAPIGRRIALEGFQIVFLSRRTET